MISITDKTQCCGCTACAAVCPKNCITMRPDGEGFLYPAVNADACVGCGACDAVCPVKNRPQAVDHPQAAAVRANDRALRLFSSSGGVFSLLATDVLNAGGAVCGAVYDENFQVRHVLAWDEAGVEPMRGAKYVQSDLNDVFSQIRGLLADGVPVLFSGTPCQTAGLRSLLRGQPENLLTVAVVCHGAPSPRVWEKNLRELGNVTDVRLRDKRESWKHYATNYFADGREIFRPVMDDPYMKGFLRDLFNRPSCAACPAKGGDYADLTLGDFWGIEKILPALDDDKGTSLVLVHSEKGRQALAALRDRVESRAVPLADAVRYNPAVTTASAAHPQRDEAMRRMETEPLARVVADYTKASGKEKLMGFARKLLGRK